MNNEQKFTPGVRDLFLAEFRDTGNLRLACEAAGVSRSTVQRYRADDEDFAKAYAEAEEDAADNLERAAYDRAVNGMTRRRFDKEGNCIGEETVYSDRMLELLLKARRPQRFRENTKLELTGANDGPVEVDVKQKASRIAGILGLAAARKANSDLA